MLVCLWLPNVRFYIITIAYKLFSNLSLNHISQRSSKIQGHRSDKEQTIFEYWGNFSSVSTSRGFIVSVALKQTSDTLSCVVPVKAQPAKDKGWSLLLFQLLWEIQSWALEWLCAPSMSLSLSLSLVYSVSWKLVFFSPIVLFTDNLIFFSFILCI